MKTDLRSLFTLWHAQSIAKLYPDARIATATASPVILLGVRAARSADQHINRADTYDDVIVRFIRDKDASATDSESYFASYSGTTFAASLDPTPALIRHPINADGAAQLCPGLHFFGRGLHHGKPEWPCLIQAESVHVRRLNPAGQVTEIQCGDFAIHIHSGGAADTTNRFSAGCQITQNADGYFNNPGWANFIQPIYHAMNGNTVPYFLLELDQTRFSL